MKIGLLKRFLAIVVSLLAAVGVITVAVAGMRRIDRMEVRFSKRDLPEHGVHIITSADPSFAKMVSDYFKGKSDNTPTDRMPAVFIQNSSNRKIVAYALVWRLVKADGKVVENKTAYAEPGILMGDQMPDDPAFKHWVAIDPNSVRCFSWSSQIQPDVDYGSIGGINTSKPKSSGMETSVDLDALQTELISEISKATDLTVTIDGLFFDDGVFVGPNQTGFFERIQATVNAKVDLLHEIVVGSEQDRLDETLDFIAATPTANDKVSVAPSTPDEYYSYYRKLYATEITEMRRAYGKERLVAQLTSSYKRARLLKKG